MTRSIPALLLATVATVAAADDTPPASSCQDPIADIYERVSPAVVSIAATSLNPFRPLERVSRVEGSGFIFDPAGLVLTNSHVVFGRQAISVTLDDGTSLPAEMIGADPIFDIAVIRIPPPATGSLPVLLPGQSERLRVGDEVMAIGNPLGLDQTLTRGVVSAINRLLPDVPYSLTEPLIQTDAPINPGNSGGPLINRCGEVVGITSMMLPEAQNIGFAIPIDLVKEIVPALLKDGHVIRPWFGVKGQMVTSDLQNLLRIPLPDGLLVEVVEPGSPAERAGVRGGQLDLVIAGHPLLIGGDVITAMNGVALGAPEKFAGAIRSLQVGAKLRITLVRDGKSRDLQVTLPERPLLPGDLPEHGSAYTETRTSASRPRPILGF